MSTTQGLNVNANAKSQQPLKKFWSHVIGAGRAAEGLRADWQQHLKMASTACGFKYVRFHGLFHDDMFVYHENDGVVSYNFQYIDALFDALLDMNVRPFVQLGFCPSALATEVGTVFWWKGNGSPPKDLNKWRDLVLAFVQHCVDKYGIEDVATWYFECWNEPNLNSFWSGTRSQYYELYSVSAKAVKSVSDRLRVGGPSTSNFVPDSRFDGEKEDKEVQKGLAEIEDINSLEWKPVWVEHFLEWCHAQKLPVDFISCHPYSTDWALDESGNDSHRVRKVDATPIDLALIRKVVSQSHYPSAEIHLTEWSSSPSSRDHAHDYVPAAIYMVKALLASNGLVHTLAHWTFTDVFEEQGAGPTTFHGGFGLINLQGYRKPTFHAFRLLNWLGDEVLQQHSDHGCVSRSSTTGLLSALLFHYPPELATSPPPAYNDRTIAEATLKIGKPVKKSIVIEGLAPGAAFRCQILAPGHRGDVVSAWRRLGSPDTLSKAVAQQLDDYSSTLNLRILIADAEGRVVFQDVLEPWTLVGIAQIK